MCPGADNASLQVHVACVYCLLVWSILYSTLFLLYSDADVHTLIACVSDALEQQNSGTAVNDRYMKSTFDNIDGTSVESCPCISTLS